MRKLTVFNFITLNGFYKGMYEDISWHRHDQEEDEFAINALHHDHILLFGRTTYDMMAGYWSSPKARRENPEMADSMNKAEKVVFSRTLDKAVWYNTTLIKDDIVNVIKKMKRLPGKDLTILGSGNIVSQFAEAEIIDQYQIMINPIAIGSGVPIFQNIINHLHLHLVDTKVFKNGSVLLTYDHIKRKKQ